MLHSAGLMMGYALPPYTLGQSSTTAGGSDTSSTVVSGSVTAQPNGGSGLWDALWTRLSGSTSIVPTMPASLITQWQATGMSVGTLTAVYDCAVTDRVTGETKHISVTVTLTRGNPAMSVSTPADIFTQTPSSAEITVSGSTSVSISGGVGPFTVSWSKSGDFVISPSGNSCGASRLLAPTGGVQGTITVTVFDQGTGQSVTQTCYVTLINNGSAAPPLSVSAAPSSVEGFSDAGQPETNATTATVSGAVGAVTWQWRLVSGVGSISSPNSATTTFGYSMGTGTATGTFEVKVTDSLGRSATATVAATFRVWINPNPN